MAEGFAILYYMKISVAVIAHNEERWVKKCIESLLEQTRKPDEIIVLAHNCTDRTVEIVKNYPVKVIELFEGSGTIVSRMHAIESCGGEIICCTDGDCWVDKNWVKNISKHLLTKNISIVAGYTKILNNWFWRFSCWCQFVINRKVMNMRGHRFAWGSNFAFRKEDYEKVGGLLPFLKIKKDLGLNYNAEDLYISLALQKTGEMFCALNANVYTYMPPEKSSLKSQKEIVLKQVGDNRKLFSFFKV